MAALELEDVRRPHRADEGVVLGRRRDPPLEHAVALVGHLEQEGQQVVAGDVEDPRRRAGRAARP